MGKTTTTFLPPVPVSFLVSSGLIPYSCGGPWHLVGLFCPRISRVHSTSAPLSSLRGRVYNASLPYRARVSLFVLSIGRNNISDKAAEIDRSYSRVMLLVMIGDICACIRDLTKHRINLIRIAERSQPQREVRPPRSKLRKKLIAVLAIQVPDHHWMNGPDCRWSKPNSLDEWRTRRGKSTDLGS